MMSPLAWFSAMALGFVAACSSCGTGRSPDAVRRCRQDAGEAYHLAPFLEGQSVARAAEGRQVEMRVQLPLRDGDGLDALLAQIYDPNSPRFLQFLTVQEFQTRFHPTPEHHASMRKHMETYGLTVSPEQHGATLTAHGTVGQAQKAFSTEIHNFKSPKGDILRAPIGPLGGNGIPSVRAVHGLTTPTAKQTHVAMPKVPQTMALFAGNGFMASDIRRAYGVPDAASAENQTIGFVQLDGYLDSDIDAYARANNIARTPTKNILIGGYDGKVMDKDSQVEVTMDLQLAMGLVSGKAKELRVYSARNTSHAFIAILNEIANPSLGDKQLVKYISCSWGTPEDQLSPADVQAEHDLFRQMAAQGQVFMAASGDSGGKADGQHVGTDDPASQPYVVGVGGTNLSLHPDGKRNREIAWSGSGGGVSCFWPAPFWQHTKFGIPALDLARNVPDVALHSDPSGVSGSHLVIVNGQRMQVGGTSAAAPIWTAFSALAGERRLALGKHELGHLSPHLYHLGKSSLAATIFFDVDAGDNGVYSAEKHYDLTSGWGPFVGNSLLDALDKI